MMTRKLPPIPETYSTTIATRYLELKHQNGSEKVTVEIGLPLNDVETVTGFDWRCPIKITIGENTTDENYRIICDYACGMDSFQALELATNTLVEAKLTDIAKGYQATLSLWDDREPWEKLEIGDTIKILSVPQSDIDDKLRQEENGGLDDEFAFYTADIIEHIIKQHPIVCINNIDEFGTPWFSVELNINGDKQTHNLAIMDNDSWEKINTY